MANGKLLVNMPDPSDEVALNVLLAEGLDVPTAWEASQVKTTPARKPSLLVDVFGLALLLATAVIAAMLCLACIV